MRVLPHEFAEVIAILSRGHDAGMTHKQMGEQVGIDKSTVHGIMSGQVKTVHRKTYDKVRRLRITGAEPVGSGRTRHSGAITSPDGTLRRLRALVGRGFPVKILAEMLDIPRSDLRIVVSEGRKRVYTTTAADVRRLYEKLQDADPADYGVTPRWIAHNKERATAEGWAPPICWDDDTIDDPDAFAEWTGECGTVTGYNLHRKHEIHVRVSIDRHGQERVNVLCEACCKARIAEKRATEDKLAARRAECEAFLREGRAMRWIADELGMSTRTVQRVKRDMDNDNEG